MGILLVWAGGEHEFALRIGELEALQQATGSGPGQVLSRLHGSMETGLLNGPWKIADILDTLRLGLIGAGMPAIEARNTVSRAVDRVGLPELIPAAAEALLFSLSPREADDAPGKRMGAETPLESGILEPS